MTVVPLRQPDPDVDKLAELRARAREIEQAILKVQERLLDKPSPIQGDRHVAHVRTRTNRVLDPRKVEQFLDDIGVTGETREALYRDLKSTRIEIDTPNESR